MSSKVCLSFGIDYENVCTLQLIADILSKNTFLRVAYTNNCC